jgi:hypothetical protein
MTNHSRFGWEFKEIDICIHRFRLDRKYLISLWCYNVFRMLLSVNTCLVATFYSFQLIFLPQGQGFANAGHRSMTFRGHLSSAGISAINPLFRILVLQENRSTICAAHCAMNSHKCVSLLFSESLKSCNLLSCHLPGPLVSGSEAKSDWGYWKNQEGKDCLFQNVFYFLSKRQF